MTTATTQPTIQHEINCTMAQSLPPPSSSPIHSSSPQIHGLLLSTVTTPPSSTLSYQRSRPLTHTSTAVKVRQRGITPVYFIIIMKIVTPHHLLSSPFLFHRRFRSVKARKWLRSEENCECSNWLWINNKGFWTHLSFHPILAAAPPLLWNGMLMKIHSTGVFTVCRRGSDWGVTKIVSDAIDCV